MLHDLLTAGVARAWLAPLAMLVVGGCHSSSSPSSNPPNPPPSDPAPSVTSLVPASATAGGINFVLTVNGSGFVSTSVVQWNGSAKATTFVNATTLQAPIPASDIAEGGTVAVTVFNPPPTGGVSAAASFVVSNPAPTVTAVSPSFVPPGAAAFQVTVDGTGFVASSVVRWNGADRPTTFVSATQLRASISAADVAAQGIGQVTVVNAAPGGGTSSTQNVFVGNPEPAISGLDPPIVRPGGAAFTLKVLGSLYVPTSIVSLNGVNAQTTFVSASELQVAVSAADIASNGVIQVAAINPAPGGGTSSFLNLTVAPFGVTERISVASDGTQANGGSSSPSISFEGRYVTFMSLATNLVANDTNGRDDVFLRDTCAGAVGCVPSTSRISVASAGGESNDDSSTSSVSGDGRYVAFASEASNLVPGDLNNAEDVFVRDTCAGVVGPCTPTTTLISVASDGSQGGLESTRPSISRDGRFIAFLTASILVLPDVNNVADAFVRDTCVGVATGCSPSTIRVSSLPNAGSTRPVQGVSIGHDGRFVAYLSTNPAPVIRPPSDIHVVDTCSGAAPGCTPSAVLVQPSSFNNGGRLFDRSLSDDARIVAYAMDTFTPTPPGTVSFADSCIGAPAGCTVSSVSISRVSVARGGVALSATGRFVVFVTGDVFEPREVVLHDNCFGAPAGCFFSSVTLSGGTGVPTIDGPGHSVAFVSGSDLLPGATSARLDIFLALTGR